MKNTSRGFTLLEVMFTVILIGFLCIPIAAVTTLLSRTYKSMDQELGEYSAQGSTALEFISQRIMRSQSTEVQDSGKTLWLTYPDPNHPHGTVTQVSNQLRYFPEEHRHRGDVSLGNSQLLAKDVRNVNFEQDHQAVLQWVVGNPVPDGIAAATIYVTDTSPPRVKIDLALGPNDTTAGLTMITAVTPRVSPFERETVRFVSPVINGELAGVKKIGDKYYAQVKVDAIAMHSPRGFQSVNKELFYVHITLNLARTLEDKTGVRLAFMGDILPDIEGKPAMEMNSFYAQGVALGKQAVEEATAKIEQKKEGWYEKESQRLKTAYDTAQKKGIDISDWHAAWKYLQKYYGL